MTAKIRQIVACLDTYISLALPWVTPLPLHLPFPHFSPKTAITTMCPLGVDQTQRRPPKWSLLAPELKQRQDLPNKSTEENKGCNYPSPIEFLSDGLSWGAFEKLARPTALRGSEAQARTAFLPAWLETQRRPAGAGALSALESLPTELLCMVTADLEIADRTALGLCSQQLWCHFLGGLRATYRAGVAPWAGRMVLCTSTWLTELPPAIYAAYPEIAESNAWWLARTDRHWGMPPARRWNWDTFSFADVAEVDPEPRCLAAFEKHAVGLSDGLRDELGSRITREFLCPRSAPADGGAWVLRNLDTREVVRFEKLPPTKTGGGEGEEEEEGTRIAVSGYPWLTLDFALIMRICWSVGGSDYFEDSAEEAKRSRLDHGVWAAHRFELTEAGELGLSGEKEGWRDVTDELVNEAKTFMD